MRLLIALLLLAAVGLSAYNTLEVRRLRGDVEGLRASAAASTASHLVAEARARELRDEAGKHFARAQELTRGGDVEGARRETQAGLDLLAESEAAKAGSASPETAEAPGSVADRLKAMVSRVGGKVRPEPESP